MEKVAPCWEVGGRAGKCQCHLTTCRKAHRKTVAPEIPLPCEGQQQQQLGENVEKRCVCVHQKLPWASPYFGLVRALDIVASGTS